MTIRKIVVGTVCVSLWMLVLVGGIGLPVAQAQQAAGSPVPSGNPVPPPPPGGTATITTTATVGNLTITKVIINTTATSFTPDQFTINVTGTNVSKTGFPGSNNGTWITLDAGAYSVTQTSPTTSTTLSTVYSGDCTGTMNAGGNKTCTITDTVTSPLPATCANGTTLNLAEAKAAVAAGKIILATIEINASTKKLTGRITNNTACTLPASLAAFTIDDPSDPTFSIQTLADSTRGLSVPANGSTNFMVNMPVCNFQADYFYGDNAPTPKGDRQNTSPFFLDGGFIVNRVAAGGFSCTSPASSPVPSIPSSTPVTPVVTTTPATTPSPTPTGSASGPAITPTPTPQVLGASTSSSSSGRSGSRRHPVEIARASTEIYVPVVLGTETAGIPDTGRDSDMVFYLNSIVALCIFGLFLTLCVKKYSSRLS